MRGHQVPGGTMSAPVLAAVDPGDCPAHPGIVEVLGEHRRRLDLTDRHDGEVLAALAKLQTSIDRLDRRIDELAGNQATLATTLVATGRTASVGGWMAGTGGAILAIVEAARPVGHALGWW